MAITQEILSMDAYYVSTDNKVIINDIDYYSVTDVESLNANLMTVYNGNVITTIPSCSCGAVRGRYNLKRLCSECGTIVTGADDQVKPFFWLQQLDPQLPFLNPVFYNMFNHILHKKLDLVRWMMDNKYNPPNKLPTYLVGVKEIMGERNYYTFVQKLPEILVYLKNLPDFRTVEKANTLKYLHNTLTERPELVYSKYLPIINKKLFVMENTTKGKFTNLAIADVIDVVMFWIKTTSDDTLTLPKASHATYNSVSKLSKLYLKYYDKYLLKKPGTLRKHIYGARTYFSFRAVITSINGRHKYNEIEVPWAIGVTAFRPHLINKLSKRGHSYKNINKLLSRAVKTYTPLIDELLKELISDSRYEEGIPVLSARNPSLLQGSSQFTYISRFKTDVKDLTVGFSFLIAPACNADYDGDALNFIILLDNKMAEEFKTLEPHFNVPDLSTPYSVSGNLTMEAPANVIMTRLLMDKEPGTGDNSLANMLSID